MTALAIILTFFYVLGLVWIGLSFTKRFKTSKADNPPENQRLWFPTPGVSIIIPFRNESQNLPDLMKSLDAQVYPEGKVEFILVDDHSEDLSGLLQERYADKKFRWLTSESGSNGKKSALEHGINHATFDIIITTDADCRHQSHWIESMVQPFLSSSTQLVIGPVKIDSGNFFTRLQQLEFSAVVATGMLLAGQGKPMYCNGANLAFRKSAFSEVNGYSGNHHLASGDDVFLLEKIRKVYSNGIEVAWMNGAVVITKPVVDFKAFYHQRVRWAGKTRNTNFQSGLWLGLGILIFQLFSVYGWMFIFSGHAWNGLLILLPRWLAEVWLLKQLSNVFSLQNNLLERFYLSVAYPVYVVMVAVSSWLYAPAWKGRPIRNQSHS